eukprot:766843-Hanusia_phi.AAC.1
MKATKNEDAPSSSRWQVIEVEGDTAVTIMDEDTGDTRDGVLVKDKSLATQITVSVTTFCLED